MSVSSAEHNQMLGRLRALNKKVENVYLTINNDNNLGVAAMRLHLAEYLLEMQLARSSLTYECPMILPSSSIQAEVNVCYTRIQVIMRDLKNYNEYDCFEAILSCFKQQSYGGNRKVKALCEYLHTESDYWKYNLILSQKKLQATTTTKLLPPPYKSPICQPSAPVM
jgi:hypothetical protein